MSDEEPVSYEIPRILERIRVEPHEAHHAVDLGNDLDWWCFESAEVAAKFALRYRAVLGHLLRSAVRLEREKLAARPERVDLDEREACAALCDAEADRLGVAKPLEEDDLSTLERRLLERARQARALAAAIRARNTPPDPKDTP